MASNHKPLASGDLGWWGWTGSRNYLFADSHVDYLRAEKIRKANDGNPNPNLTIKGIKGIDYTP
ncbi:MAG: hypothetical protein ACYSSI_06410 [Planctomycetota bacterium]|jgi:prepilin-type processing-associated H-X9-DG protein